MPSALTVEPSLTDARRTQVEALVDRAEATDGYRALNEAAELALRHADADVTHLLTGHDGHVVAYAQLQPGRGIGTGFCVVDPAHRRQGLGVRLGTALLDRAPGEVQLLAPTDSPAAQALAARLGLVPRRTLLLMRRPLTGRLPAASVPPGVTIRTFVLGQDEPGWLAVNAAAFADHPEQGAVTAAGLAERLAEPWFDPEGFFVAQRTGADALVGFHWTKRHPDGLGEVYVLGVDPDTHRKGLGRALLGTGLHYLQQRGCSAVVLYVEAASAPAVALYSGYGFTTAARDVMYAQRPPGRTQES